jgi:hypothetical protein
MSLMGAFLHLRALEPLATSGRKLIFQHPLDDGLIVKVIRPSVLEESLGVLKAYKRFARHSVYRDFLRVLEEDLYIRMHATRRPPPVQKVVGIADTDFGPGLVTETVRDTNGGAAPTLNALLSEGRFTAAMQKELEVTTQELVDHEIILNDLSLGNFVYSAEGRFILVDGYGEKAWIPLCSWSRILNRRSALRKINEMMRNVRMLASRQRLAA